MERPRASTQQPDRVQGVGVKVSTVVGLGTLLSALVGLLVGWAIGDVPRGLGNVFVGGMVVTVIVAFLVAARSDRARTTR